MGKKRSLSANKQLSDKPDIQFDQIDFEIEPNPQSCSFKRTSQDPNKNTKKPFKSLKQIILSEKSEKWNEEDRDYLYSSIDALPSFLPVKKYSDLSGLPALYTDPHTKLRYSTSEEYSRIKSLPSDIVMGLLMLRKSSTQNP